MTFVEAVMFGHSSMHAQFKWAKKKIDAMDSKLAALERKAGKLKSRAAPQAKRLFADLKKRRSRFDGILRKHAKDNDAAWRKSKVRLEKEWKTFEAKASKAIRRAVAR